MTIVTTGQHLVIEKKLKLEKMLKDSKITNIWTPVTNRIVVVACIALAIFHEICCNRYLIPFL